MIATKNAEIWHSLNYSLPFIFIKFYDILINILICNWLSCFSSKYWSKISSCIFSEFLYLHNCRWFWKVLAPCTDPCGPNWSNEAASTAADDDLYWVETCTDPCGPNWSDKAASTATHCMYDICIYWNECF